MVGRKDRRFWCSRGYGLLAAAALAGTCAWRAVPASPTAFGGARAAWRSTGAAAAKLAWGSSGGSRQAGAARGLGVARRAEEEEEEEDPNERDVFGGDDNPLSAQRPLPPNTERFGDSIWFDVTVKAPYGIGISDGPEGPGFGVGVNAVGEVGSVPDLNREALADGAEPAMWVQEGDELVQVDGQSTEGSRAKALELIEATGDTATLTFSRPAKGYIKVVFPGGKAITSPRGAKLLRLAEKVGYDSGCRSYDGRDENCWMKDPATGEIYVLPLNVPGIVPSVWRAAGEEGMRPGEGEMESWVPLRLVPAPEAYRNALEEEARMKAKMDSK